MNPPETQYYLFFRNEASVEAALMNLAWREEDYHGEIVSGCDHNGTPLSLTIWCRPCCIEGLRNIAKEVGAYRITDEVGREI